MAINRATATTGDSEAKETESLPQLLIGGRRINILPQLLLPSVLLATNDLFNGVRLFSTKQWVGLKSWHTSEKIKTIEYCTKVKVGQ